MNHQGSSGTARARRTHGTHLLAAGALAALVGCTAGATPHSRLVSVHNAFEGIGMGPLGHISEGSLAEGGTVRFPMELDAQCYVFVAFGGDGVRDVDVAIMDAGGTRVAADTSHDGQATVQYCPSAHGSFTATVRMAAGGGAYAFSTWRGGGRGASAASAGGDPGEGGAGTCANPIPIQVGATVTGSTERAHHGQVGSCLGDGEAPELVYVLRLDHRQQVTVAAEQDYDGALYIRSACEDAESEVSNGCNDDEEDTRHSRVVAALDPGTYYIFADGYADNSGSFSLTVTGADVPSPAEVCQNATPLTAGQSVSGQTTGDVNVFQATCAAGARGPDRVYRLDVPQESRLQISQESDYDGVLYVRRACADAASEVACNDDVEDTQHSRINTVVPAGTYYVFTDGYSPGASGNYTLEADLSPVAGAGTRGDTCADALPLTPGTALEGNTFSARDDVAAPCGAAQDGYDVVYRLDVPNRARVRLWFEANDIGHNSVIYLARNCTAGAANAAVACRAGAVGEENALDQVVDRGQYFVVVDSATARAFGRFRIQSRIEDTAALERACRAAPVLHNHQHVTGTTAGADRFQAGCADRARSPENLYRIVLRRRSFVRLALESNTPNYDPAIYVRADCMDPGTERECNDDAGDVRHSLIETTLPPGTYTVFVDGFARNNQGAYAMDVTINPQ